MRYLKQCPVTVALIIINVVVYIFLEYKGMTEGYMLYNAGVLSLGRFQSGAWYTLITSMFLHGSPTHILCNMVSLYYLGVVVERVFGKARFLIIYFVAGICGGLLSLMAMKLSGDFGVVGASGAIFGLFGAYGYMLIREHRQPTVLRGAPSARSLQAFFIFLVINIAMGFMPGVAMQAHIGGLVAGFVLAILMYPAMRRKAMAVRSAWQIRE